MKQEERNQQSNERILHAAIAEFGQKGYGGASLNTMLSENGLSKGLLYHYYESRDQLYVACVQQCFNALTQALSAVTVGESTTETLCTYFEARERFFLQNPSFERIFLDTLMLHPSKLEGDLVRAQAGFQACNRKLFLSVLHAIHLREDVSEEDALSYFVLVQNAFHFQRLSAPAAEAAQSELVRYDRRAHKTLQLLLYGLAGRNEI